MNEGEIKSIFEEIRKSGIPFEIVKVYSAFTFIEKNGLSAHPWQIANFFESAIVVQYGKARTTEILGSVMHERFYFDGKKEEPKSISSRCKAYIIEGEDPEFFVCELVVGALKKQWKIGRKKLPTIDELCELPHCTAKKYLMERATFLREYGILPFTDESIKEYAASLRSLIEKDYPGINKIHEKIEKVKNYSLFLNFPKKLREPEVGMFG